MNSRISRFVLPLVAVVVYIFLDLCYVFLARNRYAEVVKQIQRGEEMQFDVVAAVCCYIRKSSFKFVKLCTKRFLCIQSWRSVGT